MNFMSVFIQTLLFMPMIVGIYFSYKVLKLTDLTVDGSFVLGAALYARLTMIDHIFPVMALILALFGGGICGLVVAYIQKDHKIPPLIASILALLMLYSVNFQIMGRPNITVDTMLLSQIKNSDLFLGLFMTFIAIGLLLTLNKTHLGLKLRAFGDQPHLLKRLHQSPENLRRIGLFLSNLLAALSGIGSAQVNGFADLNMGVGVALTSIGAVIIGTEGLSFLRRSRYSMELDLMGCFLGGFIYFICLNLLLIIGINPIHIKMFLGLTLVFFLRACSSANTLLREVY